jgi:hypothetical protein
MGKRSQLSPPGPRVPTSPSLPPSPLSPPLSCSDCPPASLSLSPYLSFPPSLPPSLPAPQFLCLCAHLTATSLSRYLQKTISDGITRIIWLIMSLLTLTINHFTAQTKVVTNRKRQKSTHKGVDCGGDVVHGDTTSIVRVEPAPSLSLPPPLHSSLCHSPPPPPASTASKHSPLLHISMQNIQALEHGGSSLEGN